MADINVTCDQCGNELTVSEYTGGSTIECPDCEAAIEVPAAPASRLTLKSKEQMSTALSGGTDGAVEAAHEAERLRQDLLDDPTQSVAHVHKMRQDIKKPKTWLTYLILAVFGGGMVGVQHLYASDAATMETYAMVRTVLGTCIYLLVLYVAFQDGYLQGSLCLLLPPYMVYYAMVRIERPVVVGLVIGITIALVTEIHYMGGSSALAIMQERTDQMIVDVAGWIEAAGDKPEFE